MLQFIDKRASSQAQRDLVQRIQQSTAASKPLQNSMIGMGQQIVPPLIAQANQDSASSQIAQRQIIQREGEQTRGNQALGFGFVGAKIGAKIAGGYGALAGGAIGATYGYLSGYSSFSNHQKSNYQTELGIYRGWLATRRHNADAYDSGQIYTYNAGNSALIHSMLSKGTVMYTYDTSNTLRVAGNHGPIKHAIVAGDKDVYAAGTASLIDTRKATLEQAIAEARIRDENIPNLGVKDPGQKREFQEHIDEAKRRLVELGFAADVTMLELLQRHGQVGVLKANSELEVNEDSGHYTPSYDSGHKALEAWKNAGYNKIKWRPRHQKKGWLNSTVKDVDNR